MEVRPVEITPFTVNVPDADIRDLQARLANTRWPSEVVSDWSRGVPPSYARQLADTWANRYNWKAEETRLNLFRQFITSIDGQAIHFVHARSEVREATPLLLAHGYPSSFVEFTRMIGPLVDPEAHGGRAEEAFHVVVPSIPGFGFSEPAVPGWGIQRTANAFDAIMQELGYERYSVSGGDVGAGIAEQLCILAGERIIGSLLVTDPGAIATEYEHRPSHRRGEGAPRGAEGRTSGRLRVHRGPDDEAAVDRVRADRFTGDAAHMDRREGHGVDAPHEGAAGGRR
jgi:pimeloyl-ACP methyl ester carboxylesterase